MLKPKLLRQALTNSLSLFQTNPEQLKMFVDGGRIVSTLAPSLSFENQYTLTLFIEDFPDDVDYLFVPILAWLREHQPDIMATEEKRRSGFIHKIDVISDVLSDIRIDLQLTERAIVKEVDGALHVDHALEPAWPGAPIRPTAIYFNGETIK
ncbi:phage tail protein [Yersinia enterocolitica]|uniref:phage tail protein n=1 Tax=Yersinia enterocolitica TaxID=630 RepID=UPI000D9F8C23|nr:phage tail protein [Yersinia enterocolitica]SQA35816.1 phage tail protein [Yersinia enterocolitica]SUP63152.1 phage tail protein [Yersinia enterocolitica]